jgi:hypothetical protein
MLEMRIRKRTIWLAGAALTFCLRLPAQDIGKEGAAKVSCPDTVMLTDPRLASPIVGWEIFFDTAPHRLSRVTFFDGPVAENASLVPDKETRVGKTRTAKWLLQAKPERPYWLACYYSGSSLALSRALPAGVKECDVVYDASVEIDGTAEIKSLACR